MIRTFQERKKERKSRVRVLERPMQLIQISRKKKTFYVSKRAGLIYSAWTGPRNSSVTHFRENADVARLYTIYREKKYGLRLCLLSINLALMKPAPLGTGATAALSSSRILCGRLFTIAKFCDNFEKRKVTFLCDKSKGLEQNYARSGVMINTRRCDDTFDKSVS